MADKQKHYPYVMLEGYAKLAGYSLEDLATTLKQTPRTIRNKISGKSDFSLTEMNVIVKLLARPMADVFLCAVE